MTGPDVGRLGEVVADRLRHLAPQRLAPVAPQVEVLLHRLAVLACQAEGEPPHRLTLPERRAWGDVVAVLAGDLARSVTDRPDVDLEASAVDVLTGLRRLLP
jgi:hypothetical protein